MARLRVLLGDDHTLVRQGLRKILEDHGGYDVVGEAGTGREAIQLAMDAKPDVVVLDIAMPQLNGIEAARQIARRTPQVKVLFLSMHADEAYVTRALQAGAKGYLLKDSAGQDLIRAIDAVARGRTFFSEPIASQMLDDYVRRVADSGAGDRFETLSDREREVFQLLAEGRSNKEIAELLSISVATVETHRARVLQKLDVHSLAELVLFAVRRGIVA
ncbi:MAG: response regulator transcription factor [Acidobacteriota bacterium]